MANSSNKFIVVSGGSPPENIMQRYSSIDIYSLHQRQWLKSERLPKLNHARQSHSSCALSGFVYVFGGDNASVNLLDSIERMQISSDSGYPS